MEITADQIEDLFTSGGTIDLPNGETLDRDELRTYIDATDIDTDDNGTPLDSQWQMLADILGAPDPSNVSELVEITAAANRIIAAEQARDEKIRAALTAGHSAIAVGHAANLSRGRIYQIRDRRR
ncbi:hypothetical protein ACIPW9_36445 [Streptomyces sp. NPDC090052]|uniref:hypothetical protein n=1 Tax=Streptomyces sp. NPDC090052 TaxID=3365931 RepID=UPI0037F79920